jgi:hypothetical protein
VQLRRPRSRAARTNQSVRVATSRLHLEVCTTHLGPAGRGPCPGSR